MQTGQTGTYSGQTNMNPTHIKPGTSHSDHNGLLSVHSGAHSKGVTGTSKHPHQQHPQPSSKHGSQASQRSPEHSKSVDSQANKRLPVNMEVDEQDEDNDYIGDEEADEEMYGDEEYGEEEYAEDRYSDPSKAFESNKQLLADIQVAKVKHESSKESLESDYLNDLLRPEQFSKPKSKSGSHMGDNITSIRASKQMLTAGRSEPVSERTLEVHARLRQEQAEKTREIEQLLALQFVPGQDKDQLPVFERTAYYTMPGAKHEAKKREVLRLIGYHDSEDAILGGYTYDKQGNFVDDFKLK